MHGCILVKLITVTSYQVYMTLMIYLQVCVSRVQRSDNDDHRNPVNLIDREPLKGFEPKHTEILTMVGT